LKYEGTNQHQILEIQIVQLLLPSVGIKIDVCCIHIQEQRRFRTNQVTGSHRLFIKDI